MYTQTRTQIRACIEHKTSLARGLSNLYLFPLVVHMEKYYKVRTNTSPTSIEAAPVFLAGFLVQARWRRRVPETHSAHPALVSPVSKPTDVA